ncbi:hypothetical protein Krad_4619 (plasmid) [Kineococcus radiotolerans SRS30216 = ATCC BAA-149]|uniref:Uncharacterized protein n=1 Tax=Kineococcus radiotolerans (strain ATCC BAA-149 / DSM 14245 / SRS30216) TaxID=266940 RepID=A6WGY9_KINRD|nr:hypothetical protein Krad_4619 [Kineococcus radiotolerans SRS30216 = ATCC BAA-149]
MVTAWHARPAAWRASAPEQGGSANDVEATLPELLRHVVIKHRCAPDLPPGSVLLGLDRGEPDHGDSVDRQRPSRLLITATPGIGRGLARAAAPVTMADTQWRAHQLRLLTAAVSHAVDLIVYLPEGTDALRALLEPSAGSDRYARLRPSPRQLDLASRCLREASEGGSTVDQAVLPLALPGRPRGPWPIGQPVEPVGACWLADSRLGTAASGSSLARGLARQAGLEQLHGREGGVALVVVDAQGAWQVFDDPLLSAAPLAEEVGDGEGLVAAAGSLGHSRLAGT